MTDYVNVRLTREEYQLINQVRNRMVERGLPLEVFGEQNLDDYLNSVSRDSLAKGALVGIGLSALLYLIMEKE